MDENYISNGVARTLRNIRTSKGAYCIKQIFSTITPLFKMGTPLSIHKVSSLDCHYFHYARAYTAKWELRQCISTFTDVKTARFFSQLRAF